MVTLRMIANAGRKWGPITRLADTLEHMRSILGRLWRAAPGALSVVAFCALFGVAASAQQIPSRNRNQHRQLPRHPQRPRHPCLRRLRVGSNRW